MESQFPEDEGEDAREGTAAHWVAMRVLGGHDQLEELTDRAAPNGVICDGEMIEHVQFYIDTIRKFIGPAIPVVERTLPMVPGVDDGTPDAFIRADRHAWLWDFKYGWAVVEAVGNWQLANYIVALFIKAEWQLDTVTAFIVQPRPYHPDGRVRSWTVTREQAQVLYAQLAAAAARTNDPSAPCVTGDHCNHCAALHVCEAARRASMNGVDLAYRSIINDPSPQDIAGEVRTLRRAHAMLKQRLEAIETNAAALIDKGAIIPGFSMERSWGKERWKEPAEVAVLEIMTGKELHERKPVSPAQARKRGADPALVNFYATRSETGRKLVERDSSTKAKEVFK